MKRLPKKPLIESLEVRRLLAVATVNFNDVRQTIDGFGASSAWMSGTLSAATLTNAFSTTTGAGLSLVRARMGPQGWTNETSIALQALDNGARVWSTPWTPPREWKTNHDTANGGALDPSHYQDYANYLANYCEDMKAQGVPLYALSIQNEPNWVADYESCIWTAQQFADFIPYVGQTFATRGITTKIMLPESLNWNFSLADTVMNTPALAQYVGILAAHNYGETTNSYQPYANAQGKPVWETEVYMSTTSTVIANALNLANDIHQAMSDANASAYHYWWLSSSADGGVFDSSWNPNKRLWTMGQYSRFVRPGWVRVGETDDGGLDITTFKDPASGKFAIVVVNSSTTSAINESFTLSGLTAASVTPYITSVTDNLAQYADISVTGGTTFTSNIAASSIVTFYGISSAAATVQTPTNLTAAPVQGSATTQIALTWNDNSSAETGYTVERSTDGTNFTVVTSALAAGTTKYTDTGRTENTTYYYRVKANSASGGSGYSSIVSTSTLITMPSGVSGTRTSTGINLSWTINSAASTGVKVDRSLDGVLWTTIATLSTRATTYSDTIPSYDAAHVYYYRVRNTTSTTYSGWTRWNTSVSAPTTFTSSAVTAAGVTFNWNSPTTGLSGAWIEKFNSSTSTWSVISPSALQATDGTWRYVGLSPATSYTFRMRLSGAADSVYSAYTSSINITTLAASITPIIWYKADETSGATLNDSSGNAKNASISGTYNFAGGVSSNALNLNGGYASLPSGFASEIGDVTISMWIKPTTVDTWSRLFDFGTGTTNYMFLTPKSSTGFPRFAILDNGGTQQVVDATTAVSAGVWTHIAVTQSGSTTTIYVNGTAAGSSTTITNHAGGLGATNLNYLGKSQFSWDPAYKGLMDEVRIYERALSPTEIQSLASTTAPTVATAAAATPNPVNGKTTALSVLGADNNGENNLTYTWAATTLPSGASSPTFSSNGTNASKNTTATFSKAGSYTFVVTIADAEGFTTISNVNVTVNQVSTSVGFSPSTVTVNPGSSQQLVAGALDQFGDAMTGGPAFTYSLIGGVGSVNSTGLYTAPTTFGGLAAIQATSGALTALTIVSVPMDNTDTTGVTYTGGTWTGSTTVGGYFGTNYQYYNTAGGSGTATYSTAVPLTGRYGVYARWSASANRNAAVPVDITSAGGVSTSTLNQQNSGGTWNLIGNYSFIQGANAIVKLRTPADVDPNHSVIADGVLLQLVSLAPTIETAAFSTPPVVNGSSAILSVLGADDGGESNLTYTWSFTGSPSATVTYSINGTNASKYTNVTFTQPGVYNFVVTVADAYGLSTTSSVSVTVNPMPVVIDGTGGSDIYRIRANGVSDEVYLNDVLTQTLNRSMISTLTINGSDGNDTLVLDYSNGDPTPTGGISLIGGNNSDTVEIRGASSVDAFSFGTSNSITHAGKISNFSQNETIKLSTGNYSIAANLGAVNFIATGSGTSATFTKDQIFSSMQITAGANVTSASTNSLAAAMNVGAVSIDNAKLSIAPNGGLSGVSQFSSLSLAGTGRLDLHDNDLVIQYGSNPSPYSQLTSSLSSGLMLLGGAGTSGVGSTEVDQQSIVGTMLALVDDGDPSINGAVTATSGFNLTDPAHSVIIKYTWFGDSNFDGSVNGSDYALLDSGFTSGGSLAGWVFGDYDLNGAIDGSDYALIDTGFISQDRVL